jgi:hypothetical protein
MERTSFAVFIPIRLGRPSVPLSLDHGMSSDSDVAGNALNGRVCDRCAAFKAADLE